MNTCTLVFVSEYAVQYDNVDFSFTKETFSMAVAPYCQFYKNCNKNLLSSSVVFFQWPSSLAKGFLIATQVRNLWQAKMFGILFTQNNILIR